MSGTAVDTVGSKEIFRWCSALCGIILWFAYIPVQFAGLRANGQAYCARISAAGKHCTYDYIPVVELFVVPACVLLFGYFFAKFAFGLYAPPVAARRLRWRMAGKSDAVAAYPTPQIFAGLGLCWCLYRLYALPLAFIPSGVIAYWLGWIIWFAAAIVVSWPGRGKI